MLSTHDVLNRGPWRHIGAVVLVLAFGCVGLLAQPFRQDFLPPDPGKAVADLGAKALEERERAIAALVEILKEIDDHRQRWKKDTFRQQLGVLEQKVAEAASDEQKSLREKDIEQLRQMRDEVERRVITGREATAMRLLGRLGAVEAIPYLLKSIDQPFPITNPPRGQNPFNPMHSALVAIGKPASRAAVAALADEPRITRGPGISTEINSAQLLVNVITAIEGPELGKAMVRLAAEQEADPKKKQRLRAALPRFPDGGGPQS